MSGVAQEVTKYSVDGACFILRELSIFLQILNIFRQKIESAVGSLFTRRRRRQHCTTGAASTLPSSPAQPITRSQQAHRIMVVSYQQAPTSGKSFVLYEACVCRWWRMQQRVSI